MKKFVLMALPGTGKSTVMKEWVETLNSQNISANFIQTDALINQRISAEDPVIQKYEKDHGRISPDIFELNVNERTKSFIDRYGLSAMVVLEELLLLDIIESASESDWLDFGGRALLLPKITDALKAKGIVTIFLYAEHETILKRLSKNEQWRQRPTYVLAAEKSTDGKGWIKNAKIQRKKRLQRFINNADIIIEVDSKSPQEIVREITLHLSAI